MTRPSLRNISCVIVGIGLGIILRSIIVIPLTSIERITCDVLICFFLITISWLSNREKTHIFEKKTTELYRFAEFGKLSSGVFHDLINPLNAISLIVEKLKEDSHLLNEDASKQIEQAVRASKRMESFLNTARKQLRSEHHDCCFSVKQEIEEVIRLLQYKILTSGITIKIQMAESYEIYGDPLRLFRIMLNLISNAIDSYENTEEALRRQSFVIVMARKIGKNLEILVIDTGCGIPNHVHSLIFNPFFTTKLGREGIGLGLSMTKRIIERDFKGSIRVESRYGKGSTFTVTLPL